MIHISVHNTGNPTKDTAAALRSLKKAVKQSGIMQSLFDKQEFATSQQKARRKRSRRLVADRKQARIEQKRQKHGK